MVVPATARPDAKASVEDRAVVLVGASAGGVEALRDLAATLPEDFPACVLVVLHTPRTGTSALPSILNRVGPLPARHAEGGEEVERGHILVAPPDQHLLVVDGRVTLSRGPTENGHRPAIDVLFRSGARAYGAAAFGVVLSGTQDDGAAGCLSITRRGGRCLVQDFEEALYDRMPRAAADAAAIQTQVKVGEMAEVLAGWATDVLTSRADRHGGAATSSEAGHEMGLLEKETQMAEMDPAAMHEKDRPGRPSGFGCPDCAGALFTIEEGNLVRFRCRVGHAWSAESLMVRQTVALESALLLALRSLEEKAALSSDLNVQARRDGRMLTAEWFGKNADDALRSAELLRQLVVELGSTVEEPPRSAE